MVEFWNELIDEVRKIYTGPITYAANWDDFERVRFWDKLDYVGVQAYFPLSAATEPDSAALRAGWAEPLSRMRRVSKRVKRPVLLTEIGYTNAPWTAAQPWKSSRGDGRSPLQERCLRTALEVVAETDFIVGSFLWKWFPTTNSIGPGDFTVQTEVFKELLRDTWSRGLADETTVGPGAQPADPSEP